MTIVTVGGIVLLAVVLPVSSSCTDAAVTPGQHAPMAALRLNSTPRQGPQAHERAIAREPDRSSGPTSHLSRDDRDPSRKP